MKKILITLFVCLLMCGCMKYSESDALKDLKKIVNDSKGYKITGNLTIVNNDDSYEYKVDVAYKKDDKFKVSLENKTNNHKQIILKNDKGVYVLNPVLNKSFKFQSDWPYNNSQTYLLQTLLNDIQNDKERKFTFKNNLYIFETKVDYPNNEDLVKQKIYFDKKMKPKKVEVFNKKGDILIKMVFEKIDLSASFTKKYFNLDESMETAKISLEKSESVASIETETYPMYVPENTSLTSTEKVKTEDGERIIMTFEGDNPFLLVKEAGKVSEDMEIVSSMGELYLLPSAVASVSDNMVSWVDNNISYSVVAQNMENNELMSVASSIASLPVSK